MFNLNIAREEEEQEGTEGRGEKASRMNLGVSLSGLPPEGKVIASRLTSTPAATGGGAIDASHRFSSRSIDAADRTILIFSPYNFSDCEEMVVGAVYCLFKVVYGEKARKFVSALAVIS